MSCPRQQRADLLIERRVTRGGRAGPRRYDNIIARRDARQSAAHQLAQPALHTVTHDRAANPATDGESDPRVAWRVNIALGDLRDVAQREQRARNTPTLRAHPLEIAWRPQPLRAS